MAKSTVKGGSFQITAIEKRMLGQGYVSPRMAAEKMACSVITVHRLLYDGKIKEKDTLMVGKTRFYLLEALIGSQDPQVVEALDLRDWSEYL